MTARLFIVKSMGNTSKTQLRMVRDRIGYSREYVVRQLSPPVIARTLERWERGDRIKPQYLEQLADLYKVPVETLQDNGR